MRCSWKGRRFGGTIRRWVSPLYSSFVSRYTSRLLLCSVLFLLGVPGYTQTDLADLKFSSTGNPRRLSRAHRQKPPRWQERDRVEGVF
jgi:hypothetical protein